jgi:anaerobic ribonucleoside-triphosphate reductase
VVDEDEKTVTIFIPHATLKNINVPSDEMEFADVERGMFAFGDVKLKPEELSTLETRASEEMQQKLEDENVSEEAERFAVLSVWEIYQPTISSVSPEYRLIVDFQQ